jgi:hypothetical protein
VIVGGWAHQLHRFHPLAHPPSYAAITTKDADLAFAAGAPLEGDIKDALVGAGFKQELSSDHKPPVSKYTLGADAGGFYAEFLVPLTGGGVKRNGDPDVTLARAGITAQKVRYLDLVLVSPFTVRISRDVGVPVKNALDLSVANPVSFIVQKMLIHRYRGSAKRAQDALYIHDTLDLFGRELPQLQALWVDTVRPFLPTKTARHLQQLQQEQFGAVTDVIRDAAQIPQDRTLTPERLQTACAYGLNEILCSDAVVTEPDSVV